MNDRREFLQSVGVTSAGLLAAGYTATARGYAANETIRIGAIGTGGRCQRFMQAVNQTAGAKIVAVCDVWDVHLAAGKKLAAADAFATKDYRELLARKDVDAVVIGSPDHWHVPLTIAACEAGKDVYVEKPLTHELSEGAAVVKAQNEHKRIVQVGTQQRSMPQYQQGREIIQSGQLGRIFKVHTTWNRNTPRAQRFKLGVDPKTVDWTRFLGNAKSQPFDEYRFRNWRWFYDFGGGIFTDLMVHQIDIVHWVLGLESPSSATSIGDHVMAKGVWETPDTVQTLLRYDKTETQVYFEGTFSNARHGEMIVFMGTEGTLYLDRGRLEVTPEKGKKLKPLEVVIGTGPKGADFYDKPDGEALHIANWLECIRSRKTPNAPAEAGVSAAAAAHLANQSLRSGEVARWKA
jgi:predicted dehydrogenase